MEALLILQEGLLFDQLLYAAGLLGTATADEQVEMRAAPDDVDMTKRERVEGAGIHADALQVGHQRSLSSTKAAIARSRSASAP